MTRLLLSALVFLFASTGLGCSDAGDNRLAAHPTSDGDRSSSDGPTPSVESGAASREGGAAGTNGAAGPGLLTAGLWDDNLNYEWFMAFRAELSEEIGIPSFSRADHDLARERYAGDRPARRTLDIALVVDTTGSMGDEITYLQAEFSSIAARIEALYPEAEQRWALTVYRDEADEYVVRTFDFTGETSAFQTSLNEQSAGGGGDYPEAPDAALQALADLSWRTDSNTSRVAFWVADAPHHEENTAVMADAIRRAASLDVHLYPVASSGVDHQTEATMRISAQITGGRYMFITDDSGIGNTHLEPTLPCYFVTKLDSALLRVVEIELSGEYREPTTEEIIRTGGDPTDGACTLETGEIVQVF